MILFSIKLLINGELNVNYIYSYCTTTYTTKKLFVLFVAALVVRAITFGICIEPSKFYWQADSNDYYTCGKTIANGTFMMHAPNQPIFWRTPGYPLYLSFFYWLFPGGNQPIENEKAHMVAMWLQIILTSLIPILLFFLAFSLTGILPIAWILAWVGVFHLGFVLASCYILSDALALIFFILFLFFFYKSFLLYGEPAVAQDRLSLWQNVFFAACCLALYTWIRPNGQFVFVVALFLLLAGSCYWHQKIKKVAIFSLTFLFLILPWCVRNHRLTGHWFYCSMSGPILQAFTLPKVMRQVTGKSLLECHRIHMQKMNQALQEEFTYLKKHHPDLLLSRELVCKKIAQPAIWQHPFIFAYEWCKEAVKTTFDLYSSQIVYMLKGEYAWDPLEEFLTEKIYLCLYGQPMHWSLRILMWLEFLFSLLLWAGIFAGCWCFVIVPLVKRLQVNRQTKQLFFLWIKLGFMAASLLIMTGGFGYARLRLPIDPLLLVLSGSFWFWYFSKNNKQPVL